MVYGLCVLSPVLGLFGHRHPRKFPFTNLTPASGCQDHTTSPSASDAVVYDIIRVHRILPRVDDVGQRPSFGTGRRKFTADLGQAISIISEIRKPAPATNWHDGLLAASELSSARATASDLLQ